jgi:putative superfamily III holin-X
MAEDQRASHESSLTDEIAQLIEREVREVRATFERRIEQIQEEAISRAREAGSGAAYAGGAAALGIVSAAAVASLPLIALKKVLPSSLVALLIAGAGAGGSVVLARRGFSLIKAAAPEVVERKLDEVADDLTDAVKTRVASAAATA